MKVLSAVAWPYANGPRHIGHVAGFGVPSDVFSRYMRMAGPRRAHGLAAPTSTAPRSWSQADEEGVTPRELADRNHRLIVEDLADARLLLRPLHPHDDGATTTPSCRSCSTTSTTTATSSSRPRTGRHLAVDRPHAAGPLHRGHLPDLRRTTSARGDQCDNCGNQLDPTDLIEPAQPDQRRDPGVRRDPALLPRPARRWPSALGEWLDEREASGTWRPNVIKFSQNILDDIRPRAMTRDIDWGIPVPLDGLARAAHQAALRLVRRRHRLPVAPRSSGPGALGDPDALARVVERPGGAVVLLHGQGQHHLPLPDLAGRAARVRGPGRARRRARRATASSTCRPRWSRASS